MTTWNGTNETTPPPVRPVDRVHVVFRNGVTAQGEASAFGWRHADDPACNCWDIVEYEAKEPTE